MTGHIERLWTPEEIWRKYDAVESRLTAAVSERMLELAELAPGMRVLDLATGRGEPALRAAQRVGPGGRVLGIDSSEAMLQMAREKAEQAGLTNVELRALEAEALDVAPAQFDAALARWGLMYMRAPVAALASARRALVPGGALVAALWAEPERVSYCTLPRRILENQRSLPPIDFEAPGVFHYADLRRITRDFEEAGFEIEQIDELDIAVIEAETSAEIAAWIREALGYTRHLNALSAEEQQRWQDELASALEPLRKDGLLRLGGVTRIVLARAA